MQKSCLLVRGILLAVLAFLPIGCVRSSPTPALTPTCSPTSTLVSTFTPTATTPTRPMETETPTPGPPPTATPTPAPTIILRIGWLGTPHPLWPFADRPSSADTIFSLVYDRLIYRQLDNTYAPALARSWSSPDGGKTWIFSLEPNVATHTGHAFNAADVAFSLNLYRGNARFAYYGGYMPTVDRIEATGTTTSTISLRRPAGNIEALFHWMPLLPRHVWEGIEISGTTGIDEARLIGSGPFMLREYRPGQYITLLANKAYRMGSPHVDAVTFYTYPDADTLATALRNGDVDVITVVPLERVAELKGDPGIQVVSGPKTHLRQLIFNVSREARSTGHPALKDPQVRLAIAHAIDKQQLIDLVLLGQAMPGLTVIPPVLHTWFSTTVKDVAFDLQEAQRILDDAGYRDRNGDGLREMPDGSKALDFRLFIPADSATGSREAEMLGNWLRQIGIKLSPQAVIPDALRAICCPAFDYDMILWEQEGAADPGFYLSTLTTAQIPTGLNATGYSNPAYDALFDGQATATDEEQRRQIVWHMQQIAFSDRPSIVLYYDLAVQAFRRDRFQNWLFVPNGLLSLIDERSLLQVKPVP